MRNIVSVLTTLSLLGGSAVLGRSVMAAPNVVSTPASSGSVPAVPAKFPAPPTSALSAVTPDNMGTWSFYTSAADNTNLAHYTPVTPGVDATPNVVLSPTFPQVTLPFLYWSAKDPAGVITVRPESDRNVPGKQGDLIVMWQVPAKDWYLVKIEVDNVGLDVKGGDGGLLTVSRLGAQETADTRVVDRVGVPLSSALWPHAADYPLIEAEAGDRIVLRLNAGMDGYADQWKLHYSIARTGPAGFLAQPPVIPQVAGAPLRPGLFWLGTGSDWTNSPYAAESIQLIQHFVPDLGMIMVSHQPERIVPLPFYRDHNIPTLAQTWGPTYYPYLQANNALEYTWKGEDLREPGLPLAGTTHAAALPHPATREAFERVVRSARRSGYTGFGTQDMVWVWGGGRGASGYNPATIAAFRKDLQGIDDGLQVTPLSGKPTTIKFADYARHYFGGMPTLAAFGLTKWAQYQPITFAQYSQKLKSDYTPDFLLFDLLTHYEWLKMVGFLGNTAHSENGAFQLMGNPEDVANGADTFFASQLTHVSMLSEEYFETPLFLDGAYYHFPYFTRARQNRSSVGFIMESGGGGNGIPYYDSEGAYADALELTLSTQADHMEGDFWPSNWKPLKDMLNDPLIVARYRQTLASALGFHDARRDGLSRLPPDFVSVTPRRIFRPYDTGWYPWSWRLKFPLSPEPALAEHGFNFEGIAEDGLDTLKAPQKIVLYSTSLPTEQGWNRFSQMVREGHIHQGIVLAGGLQQVVTKNFELKPFAFLASQLNFQKTSKSPSGLLVVNGKPSDCQVDKVAGDVYTAQDRSARVVMTLGGHPLVVQRSWGKGTLNVLLFDPSEPANAMLTVAVYGALLRGENIGPRWQSSDGSVARLYQHDDLMAVGVQHPRERTVRGDLVLPQGDQLTPRTWPYKFEGVLSVKVLLRPGQTYDWVALPSGAKGRATADQTGYADLRHEGTTHEVFYLLPHNTTNEARLNQISARKQNFNEAMTLGGRIPADAAQLTS